MGKDVHVIITSERGIIHDDVHFGKGMTLKEVRISAKKEALSELRRKGVGYDSLEISAKVLTLPKAA